MVNFNKISLSKGVVSGYENRFLLKTLHEFEDYYFVSKIELKSASSKAKKDCTYIFRQLQSKTYE